MAAAKTIPRCSSTTRNTVFGAEPGMYPLKTNRDAKTLKLHCSVGNMPIKRSPAIVDRTVSEKVAKGRAGIWWDSVVEKVWKHIGGNQEGMMSAEKNI